MGLFGSKTRSLGQEGHDGLVSLHWLIREVPSYQTLQYLGSGLCYGRPLLQAWLLPDLNTIPNNCVRENSLWLSGYGISLSTGRPWFESMHLFISFFVTDFVRKMGARPGLAVEQLIPFIVQKMDFLPNRLSVINK